MKILFDHPLPFLLAHGGFQIQIEQTKLALQELGLEVEWLRWWDQAQQGDLVHYFGRPSAGYVEFAHKKGMKVVMSELLTGLGSRTTRQRQAQKLMMTTSRRLLPGSFMGKFAWDAYQLADAIIALTSWERQLMIEVFDAPAERVYIIPNGVEHPFFLKVNAPPSRSEWMVCTATITERKRVVELAEASFLAKTPLWVIGAPYGESDPYYHSFLKIVEKSGGLIRYEGGISDRSRLAEIYQSARGFALLSTKESLSLSALEAAASECPLLLSDLPWARSTFGDSASYCPIGKSSVTAACLAQFYESASRHARHIKPLTWMEVGSQLVEIYRKTLQEGS